MSALCVGLGLASIVVWNAQHGWAGRRATGRSRRALRPGDLGEHLAGAQLPRRRGRRAGRGLVGRRHRGDRRRRFATSSVARARRYGRLSSAIDGPGTLRIATVRLYLLCLWGVIWCACLAASILGETEANWMVPGYVALVVLIGWRVGEVSRRGGTRARAYVAAWCVLDSPRWSRSITRIGSTRSSPDRCPPPRSDGRHRCGCYDVDRPDARPPGAGPGRRSAASRPSRPRGPRRSS